MSADDQDLPLAGVRVIDLTRILSGPFCTMLLADLGADVVKIEPPGGGDPLRGQGTIVDGLSWYFASYNRNKRSLVLDLYGEEGKATLARLVADADVLVENYRPGVLDEMGFSAERLEEINPRLVVCGISGFGRSGPYVDRPAFDFIAQAMSGYMSVNGEEGGPPLRTAIPISDLLAGLYAALGVVAALQGRARHGRGAHVGASLLGSMMSVLSFLGANHLASALPPERTGNDHPLIAPYGLYAAADGPIAIAPSTTASYDRLIAALGLEQMKADPRFADNDTRMRHRPELRRLIEAVTRTRMQAHWIAHLNAAGVPCGPLLDMGQAFADPQVAHEKLVREVDHGRHGTVRMIGSPLQLDGEPLPVRRPAPELGADSRAILDEIGVKRSKS
jgi:crotonobetainyl-CoA:carnitine CoA-transferase CaiB-like acyl-CoA transferase